MQLLVQILPFVSYILISNVMFVLFGFCGFVVCLFVCFVFVFVCFIGRYFSIIMLVMFKIVISLWVSFKEGRKKMFYLTTHSTHFIYSFMALTYGKGPFR